MQDDCNPLRHPGAIQLRRKTLDFLKGYMGNKPIRIGNQASEHIQNDVYGQAMIDLLPLFTDYRFRHQNKGLASQWTRFVLQKMELTIDEKDAGIWEFRNMEKRHCYSNLFQWAGATTALKIARQYSLEEISIQANSKRERAIEHIESCYDDQRKAYTNAQDNTDLDAFTLQLIMMGYLNPNSTKAKDHLVQLEKVLKGEHDLFYRYLHKDDFGRPKSTFLVCSFWYV